MLPSACIIIRMSRARLVSDRPSRLFRKADDLARVYLAAVKGDDDTLLELCALKLMPDAWPDGVTPGALDMTNRDLEDRWEREKSRLVDLNALSPHFPRLVRLDASAGETADRLPPLLYSRAGRSFFVPPCPGCRSPLSLCRDEAWLARTGLPSFTSSRERFVWCERLRQGTRSADGLHDVADQHAGRDRPLRRRSSRRPGPQPMRSARRRRQPPWSARRPAKAAR